MHISDGILPLPVLAGGYAVAGALCAWSAYRVRDEEIPRTAVFTAVFFVASLLHFKIYATSVHLLLNGLVGVMLGRRAPAAIVVGLFLQCTLFPVGGVSVLGVNICLFAIPALVSWAVFEYLKNVLSVKPFINGAVCGAVSVLLSGALLMAVMLTAGDALAPIAKFAFLAHIPVMIVEGIVTGFTVDFIGRVQPVLLRKELS